MSHLAAFASGFFVALPLGAVLYSAYVAPWVTAHQIETGELRKGPAMLAEEDARRRRRIDMICDAGGAPSCSEFGTEYRA